MFKVSSEIYAETDFQPEKTANGNVVSKFKFRFPGDAAPAVDKDGDFVVRRRDAQIELEHSDATELRLVGLQVWRGALLLADFFFDQRDSLQGRRVLELGAGVGLTSIAAAICGLQVTCTDVDLGGILNLIRANVARNRGLFGATGAVDVMEFDFMQRPRDYSADLLRRIDGSDVVLAADVIYDDTLTDAFIGVVDAIFERAAVSGRPKTVYVALEKRFVFTMAELDAVAPMFEYFLKKSSHKKWRTEYIPLDFPQYFDYDRCRHLVLLRLTTG